MKRLSLIIPLLLFSVSCAQQENTEPASVSIEWSEAAELPVAITNNAVAAADVNGKTQLFTFLGLQKGKTFNDVSTYAATYDIDAGLWKRIPSVPDSVGRLASTAQTAGGNVYIFGGYTVAEDGSEVSTPDVFKFDPDSYTYQQVANMLIPVEDAAAMVYKDRYIYLVSGWNNTNNVSNVQVYDTQTNSWDHATPYPGPPVFGHAGGIAGITMILSDGVRSKVDEGQRIFLMSPGSIKGVIDEEDHTKINWTRIKQHPGAARYRMAAIGVEQPAPMVIFTGGTDNPYNYNGIGYNSKPSSPVNTVLAYRLDTEEWVELGEQPAATMDHRGIARNGNDFYIIGGMGADQKVTPMVQKFNLAAGSE